MNNYAKTITTTALMAAILCILGPISLPIGPVPISLTSLALYFMVYIVGTKTSIAAHVLYMLLGLIGLPVFSGYAGGPQKLLGPTGGYIIGFLPMILIMGWFVRRYESNRVMCIVGTEAATWVLYLLGTLWLAVSTGMGFSAALAAGVIPFILPDFAKICAATFLAPEIKKRLRKSGI